MDLNRISAVLRPRRPWEAVDLGFALVRSEWRALWLPWAVALTTLLVLLHLLLPWQWVALAYWWLKPLYDRLALFVISRSLFAHRPSAWQALKAWPSQLNGIVWSLTINRFNPLRAYHLPVRQLEGLAGRACRQRQQLLAQRQSDTAWGLTLICLHLEAALVVALLATINFVSGDQPTLGIDEWYLWHDDTLLLLANIAYGLGVAVLEPCYVAGGFALYLNRRIGLEAWDLEIGFRRFTQRLAAGSRRVAAVTLLGPLVAALALGVSTPLQAQSVPTASEDNSSLAHYCREQERHLADLASADNPYLRQLAAVYDAPELQRCRLAEELTLTFEERDQPLQRQGSLLNSVVDNTIALLLVLLLVAVLLRLVWLWRRDSHRPRVKALRERSSALPPLTSSGLSAIDEHFDPRAVERAEQLARAGCHRQALSLLYRHSLAGLAERYRITIPTSYTEAQSIALIQRQTRTTELTKYLQQLITHWQRVAYGHRPPPRNWTALCQQWRRWFVA